MKLLMRSVIMRIICAAAIGLLITTFLNALQLKSNLSSKPDGNTSELTTAGNEILSEIKVSRDENILTVEGWAASEGIKSDDIENTVVLIDEAGNYFILPKVKQENFTDISSYFKDGLDHTSANFKALATHLRLESGIYRIGVISALPNETSLLTVSSYELNGSTELLPKAEQILFIISWAFISLMAFISINGACISKDTLVLKNRSYGNEIVKRKILNYTDKVFLTLVFLSFVYAVVIPIPSVLYSDIHKPTVAVIVAFMVMLIIMFLYYTHFVFNCQWRCKLFKKYNYIVLSVFFIGLFLVQYSVFTRISTNYSWDVSGIHKNALQIAEEATVDWEYFYRFPNNEGILTIATIIAKIVQPYGTGIYDKMLIIINILLCDVAILLTYLCSVKLFGSKNAALALTISVPIIGFNPWIIWFYTDIVAIIFPVALFYIYLCFKKTNKMFLKFMYIIITGFLSLFAIKFKYTAVAVVFAIVVLEVVNRHKTKLFIKQILIYSLIFATSFFICTSLVNVIIKNTIPYPDGTESLKSEYRLPITHFILLGQTPPRGAYNANIVSLTYDTPAEERVNVHLSKIKDNLVELGPFGYFNFINNKFYLTYADGIFHFQNEGYGNIYKQDSEASIKNKLVFEVFADTGRYYRVYAYVFQALWCVILLLIALPIFSKWQGSVNISILRMTLLLLCAYLMLSETRSRQLVCYLPIYVLLATGSFKYLFNHLTNIRIRLRG